MKSFDYYIKDMTRGIEDHEFKHYNRALGCMIYSKEHYISELKRRGLVPFDMACAACEEYEKKNPRKEYELSSKARSLINHFKLVSKDGYYNLKEHPKVSAELKSMGLDFDRNIEEFINQSNLN